MAKVKKLKARPRGQAGQKLARLQEKAGPAAFSKAGPERQKWPFFAVGLALVLLLGYRFFGAKQAPSSAPAADISVSMGTVANWGPSLSLETVSKFDYKGEMLAMQADAQGNVFVLTKSKLQKFSSGKLAKSLELKAGGLSGAMALDGKTLYVSNFSNDYVSKLDTNLADRGGFSVEAADRLLGIAYSPLDGGKLFITDVAGKNIFITDTSGKSLDRIKGPRTGSPDVGFAFDLQVDAGGNIFENDLSSRWISFFSPDHKLKKIVKSPWNAANQERLAPCKGLIYINCVTDKSVLVMDAEGNPVGHMNRSALMIAAGQDGFLYLYSDGKILKLKPLPAGARVPSAAPLALSPGAKGKP